MGTFSSETSANWHKSGKFETLIALQNDLRWLFLHSWFSKFPRGRSPGPSYKKRYKEKFGISFFYPTSVPRHHPHSPLISSYWYKNVICWAIDMIIYDFVICGFIGRIISIDPLFSYITSASALIWLLLCSVFDGSGQFYWLSKFSTD